MIRTATLLILIMCLSYVSIFVLHQPTAKQTVPDSAADMIFEGLTIKDYNQNGDLHQVITATHAHHDSEQKMDFYTQPHIKFISDKQNQPWYLKSDKGHSNSERDTLYFEHHVVIHQNATSTKPRTQINTDTLTYYAKRKIAETHDKIMLQQGNTQVKSIGAELNLDTQHLKLLSEPEGIYG